MKMEFEILADLIIHSFLRGVDYDADSDPSEGLSDTEEEDEYYLFRPVGDKDGDWDYNDET